MIDYSKYPPNWKTVIRPRILERAKNKCEWCGLGNREFILRGDGENYLWYNSEADCHYDQHGYAHRMSELPSEYADSQYTEVVLTIAHVHDHNPLNCADDNLAALCQRCHLNHDRPRHIANARKTRRDKRDRESGQIRMFADDN